MGHETSDGKRWMTIMQVCAFFGVSRRTIYTWIAKHRFEVKRTPGGSQRLLVDVREWERESSPPLEGDRNGSEKNTGR